MKAPALLLVVLAVVSVVGPLHAGERSPVAVVRSRQAQARVPPAWGLDTYEREADLWVREIGRAGSPVHVVDDVELAEGRSTFDAVVIPFPDFDDPRAVLRLQALVEQARRVLVVGGAFRSSSAVERLRVACGAPAFSLLPVAAERLAVLKGRSFLAAEVAPGALLDVRPGAPAFATSSRQALAWYAGADLAPRGPEDDVERSAAVVGFTCGGAEVVWSGFPLSALSRDGARGPQADLLLANLTSWLGGQPWLGRAPWRDDRTLAVVLAVEVEAPVQAVNELASVLEAARVRGSFHVDPLAAVAPDVLARLGRVGDVEVGPSVSSDALGQPLPIVRDDCRLFGVGDAQTPSVVARLVDDVALHERVGGLYVLGLHAACLLHPERLSAVALFLAAAKKAPAWFATRAQVATWQKARAGVVVRPVEGGFRVANTGAVPLVAFPLVSYRFGPDDLAQLGRRGLFLPRDDGGTTFVVDLGAGEELLLPVTGR